MTYGDQALVVLTQLPNDDERRAQTIDVHLALQASLWQVGEVPRMIVHLEQAERVATAIGDEGRLGAVCLDTSFHLFLIGKEDSALENGERALAIAKRNAGLTFSRTLHRGEFAGHGRSCAVATPQNFDRERRRPPIMTTISYLPERD